MREKLLSVIVPAYNARKYIEDCVNSVINQDYRNIEIIIVDDGSSDGTKELCDKMPNMDTRIKVYHTINQGSFLARKYGVSHAGGDFVTFLDSDDWIEENTYSECMNLIKEYETDMILYNYEVNGIQEKHLFREGYYNKKQIQQQLIPTMMWDYHLNRRKIDPSLGCKIMKKNLFMCVCENIEKRLSFGDDALVTYPAIMICDSLYIYNRMFYHYRQHTDSCMHRFGMEKIDELKEFYVEILEKISELGYKNRFNMEVQSYMRSFVYHMISNWFNMELTEVRYVFPYNNFKLNEKIVVYGAGSVGQSYVKDVLNHRSFNIVGWADKKYSEIGMLMGMELIPPSEIPQMEFQHIVIANIREDIAGQIKRDLINLGIEDEKICWFKPILQ